jgi:bifunctional DNA-binding transcriptional regulator/antitoxin component of YhaV-PrlF toxin-antitoxin module
MEMISVLLELRAKSQITIPKELVDKLGLSEGDKRWYNMHHTGRCISKKIYR